MGLLGNMLAGGVKKVADGRVADIEQQEEFNMKNALLDAQIDKELRLKEAGYQMDKQHAETEAREVKAITDTVVDPMAGKGGYEDESVKVKRDYDLVSQKVSKLREAGKNDAADRLQKDLDRIDNKNNKEAALELKHLIAENNIKNQQGLLSIKEQALEQQGKIADAKNETQLAKMQLENEKGKSGSGNNKSTYKEKLYQAYVEDVKTKGRKDSKGNISKNPWPMDVWDKKQNEKNGGAKETEIYDEDGELIGKRVTRPVKDTKPVKGGLVKSKDGNYIYNR